SDRYVYLRVKGDEGDTSVIAKLAVAEQLPVKADEDAQLSVEQRHLSYFDQKTGGRIAARASRWPIAPSSSMSRRGCTTCWTGKTCSAPSCSPRCWFIWSHSWGCLSCSCSCMRSATQAQGLRPTASSACPRFSARSQTRRFGLPCATPSSARSCPRWW